LLWGSCKYPSPKEGVKTWLSSFLLKEVAPGFYFIFQSLFMKEKREVEEKNLTFKFCVGMSDLNLYTTIFFLQY
jgi:hypothetical protein